MAIQTGCYCQGCGYDLRASGRDGEARRCPECGRPFAPEDPATFRTRPLVPWKRTVGRWARRAAFVALPLLAGFALYGAWLCYGWSREQAALAKLPVQSPGPVTLGGAAGDAAFRMAGPSAGAVLQRQGQLVMAETTTDADLLPLRELKYLQELELGRTQVTDAGLAHVRTLTGLRRLGLSSTKITDAGVAQLEPLKELETLSLAGTEVTDASIPTLEKLPKLRELRLNGTNLSAEGLARLKAARPGVRID